MMMVKPYKKIIIFSNIVYLLLMSACLNPTGMSTLVHRGVVNLEDDLGHLRRGDERIYGLSPYKYYLIEVLVRGVSQGVWFVNSDGELVRELENIGRVSGGEIIGLNNDHTVLYIVRYARPLSGYVTHFDGPLAAVATTQAHTVRINGELHLRPPALAGDRYFLDLSPEHIPPANHAISSDFAANYTVMSITIPREGEEESERETFEPLYGHQFVIPLHREAHTAPYTIDYLFARGRSDGSGGFSFVRDGFYVLRVMPTFDVTITLHPVPVTEGNIVPPTPFGPFYQHHLGTVLPYVRLMFPYAEGFTDIIWRDENNNIIGTTPTVLVDFTDIDVWIRYTLPGVHLFSLTTMRYGKPWSARAQLTIRTL